MNILSRDKQIDIIAALSEGMSIRTVERLTGIHRDTIMRLGARVGQGCAELHDRMMVGLRVGRIEMDEMWSYVGKKRRQVTPRTALTWAINTFSSRSPLPQKRSSPIASANATATIRGPSWQIFGNGC